LQRLRLRIVAGDLGALYFVACYQWDGEPPPAAFRANSGGIFVDMGVHEFDQIRWLTGQEFVMLDPVVASVGPEPPIAGDADSAQVLCSLSGGSNALVSLGRRFPLGDVCRVEVFGTRDAEDCRFLWPPDGEAVFLQALQRQAEGFANWVRGGEAAGATAADAIAALEAARKSSVVLHH
jgi:myo-inositol 2-dehydrogenase/D-chiro-inositol 1-dehydrogenase